MMLRGRLFEARSSRVRFGSLRRQPRQPAQGHAVIPADGVTLLFLWYAKTNDWLSKSALETYVFVQLSTL